MEKSVRWEESGELCFIISCYSIYTSFRARIMSFILVECMNDYYVPVYSKHRRAFYQTLINQYTISNNFTQKREKKHSLVTCWSVIHSIQSCIVLYLYFRPVYNQQNCQGVHTSRSVHNPIR